MSNIITLKELFESKKLKEGDWMSRIVRESREYTIFKGKSGCEKDQKYSINGETRILFCFIREANGIIEAAGRVTDFTVKYRGVDASIYGKEELDNLCNGLYSDQAAGIITYCINEEKYDMLRKTKRVIECRNKKEMIEEIDKQYWLATNTISKFHLSFGLKVVRQGGIEQYYTTNFCSNEMNDRFNYDPVYEANVCPWHTLAINNPNLKVIVDKTHNGQKQESAYEIVLD